MLYLGCHTTTQLQCAVRGPVSKFFVSSSGILVSHACIATTSINISISTSMVIILVLELFLVPAQALWSMQGQAWLCSPVKSI